MNFSTDTIPFGIFSFGESKKCLATAVDDKVVDLSFLANEGLFDDLDIPRPVFSQPYLNDFIALGRKKTNAVRSLLQKLLKNPTPEIMEAYFYYQRVDLHLPVKVGDYTDFYSSEQHAYNVGVMFRDPEQALLPNWKHLPVGYHGRASSIFVSGTPFHRPKGQIKPAGAASPVFSETRRLDFELEMAAVIGKANAHGEPIPVDEAEEYVFGFQLFNDWSARDIQAWEYVPLGPFLAKNFFSSVSPWVIPVEALEPFRVEAPQQDPEVLPYLQAKNRNQFDIHLEVLLTTANGVEKVISRSNFKHLYWTVPQQIAHHTVTGCNLQVGDLLASGTISGREPGSFGSMLELTWGGKNPIVLEDGTERAFLEDGDTLTIRGYAEKGNIRVDFGEVSNTVLPAR
ncbi:fumarylacetoacetase [Leadbetterella sp. DM7]|uniref:fumarylacetoacetase n=1 Tax=Leadbetterella sp. DM7 TaxID=3235085 RepID=UPI00349E5AA7